MTLAVAYLLCKGPARELTLGLVVSRRWRALAVGSLISALVQVCDGFVGLYQHV